MCHSEGGFRRGICFFFQRQTSEHGFNRAAPVAQVRPLDLRPFVRHTASAAMCADYNPLSRPRTVAGSLCFLRLRSSSDSLCRAFVDGGGSPRVQSGERRLSRRRVRFPMSIWALALALYLARANAVPNPTTSAALTSQTTQSAPFASAKEFTGLAATSDTFNLGVAPFAFIARKHNTGFQAWNRGVPARRRGNLCFQIAVVST